MAHNHWALPHHAWPSFKTGWSQLGASKDKRKNKEAIEAATQVRCVWSSKEPSGWWLYYNDDGKVLLFQGWNGIKWSIFIDSVKRPASSSQPIFPLSGTCNCIDRFSFPLCRQEKRASLMQMNIPPSLTWAYKIQTHAYIGRSIYLFTSCWVGKGRYIHQAQCFDFVLLLLSAPVLHSPTLAAHTQQSKKLFNWRTRTREKDAHALDYYSMHNFCVCVHYSWRPRIKGTKRSEKRIKKRFEKGNNTNQMKPENKKKLSTKKKKEIHQLWILWFEYFGCYS
jgi:hypothetical protein